MIARTNLHLVDGDSRRRATISHRLAGSALHIEPFENAGELIARSPHEGVLLVDDAAGDIPRLIDHMVNSGKWLPIIAFAEASSPRRVVEAVLCGAVDYVIWPFDADALFESVELAQARAAAMAGSKLREAVARSRIERLTQRERQVLTGVANGLSNRMIGDKLSISPRTVEIHRSNMLNKMGANRTSDAIRIAIEAALIQ